MVNAQQWLDQKYPKEQRNQITKLDLSIKGVSTPEARLNGTLKFELFTNLEQLTINGHDLTTVDLSNCPKLKEANITHNSWKIMNLNLISNFQLIELNCANNQLTNLDLSNNINITKLNCFGNKLTSLELTNNRKLIDLNCSQNKLNSSLNLRQNQQLSYLDCSDNLLTDIQLPSNTEKLTELIISGNQFPRQNLAQFSILRNLEKLKIGSIDAEMFFIHRNEEAHKQRTSYNQFHGSLKPLQKLRKLKLLDISGTDIDSGLEYLPISLKKLFCNDRQRDKAKARTLWNSLRHFYNDSHPYMYGYVDMVKWREANKILVDKVRKEVSDYITYPEIEVKFLINGIEEKAVKQDGRKIIRYSVEPFFYFGKRKGNFELPKEEESGYVSAVSIQYQQENNLRKLKVGEEISLLLRKEQWEENSATSLKRLNKYVILEDSYGNSIKRISEGDIEKAYGGMGPAYGCQLYELVIVNKKVNGENSWELISTIQEKGKQKEKRERDNDDDEFEAQQSSLDQSQLEELVNIVMPSSKELDFFKLKEEIKNLKIESLTFQVENKNKKIEQLTSFTNHEKMHFKTRKELQRIIENKHKEISELNQQLNNLQIQEQFHTQLSSL